MRDKKLTALERFKAIDTSPHAKLPKGFYRLVLDSMEEVMARLTVLEEKIDKEER